VNRLDGRLIAVETDGDGNPVAFTLPDGQPPQAILNHLAYWREWIGVLEGEPERDVWWVRTPRGICEIHCLRQPTAETEVWLLHAWGD